MGNRGGRAKPSAAPSSPEEEEEGPAETRARSSSQKEHAAYPPSPHPHDASPPPLCPVTTAGSLDEMAASLQRCGVGCVRVDESSSALHARTFEVFRAAIGAHCERVEPDNPLKIPHDGDSAHVTGLHSAGGISAYNATREGFVFSDGNTFALPPDGSDPSFETATREMFDSGLAVATATLSALERRMTLPDGWFEREFGPLRRHAQWHVKRYRPEARSEHAVAEGPPGETEKHVLLPVHTDPSLISVVFHDAPGVRPGAMGLEYLSRGGAGPWTEVPHHGHAVATVFTGSVLDRITGGVYPAARHRVAVRDPVGVGLSRVVATFFWRPAPNAVLRTPPSPSLPPPGQFKQMQFSTWCKRVAKRYEAHKKPRPLKGKPKEAAAPSPMDAPKGEATQQPKPLGRRARKREAAARRANPEPPLVSRRPDGRDERLSLIGGPLLGREKYLGGALGNDGCIYAIPGFARRVLRIHPSTGAVEYVGPEFHGEFKWLRSVTCPKSGAIYGLPCHADTVLKIVPGEVPEITLIGEGKCGTGLWKWHGGVLSPHDGCIYCIPQFAEQVLKIDPATDTCTLIGGPFRGRNKWYGGLMGTDGRIYGVPQNATGVLRIDPAVDGGKCEVFGSFPEGGWKWHGGCVGVDGAIYGIPAHADTVLKIVPGDDPKMMEIGGPLRTGKHRTDGKYKYLGGVLGKDGRVYFVPSDADYVLQVDCATDEVREVGASLEGEAIVQNKWQNGFLGHDGVIWGIPLKAETVLTIIPPDEPGKEPVVKTVGGPFKGLNKWEGGVMSACGKMMCMPLNHKSVLEIDPHVGECSDKVKLVGRMEEKREGMASTAGMNHD